MWPLDRAYMKTQKALANSENYKYSTENEGQSQVLGAMRMEKRVDPEIRNKAQKDQILALYVRKACFIRNKKDQKLARGKTALHKSMHIPL